MNLDLNIFNVYIYIHLFIYIYIYLYRSTYWGVHCQSQPFRDNQIRAAGEATGVWLPRHTSLVECISQHVQTRPFLRGFIFSCVGRGGWWKWFFLML